MAAATTLAGCPVGSDRSGREDAGEQSRGETDSPSAREGTPADSSDADVPAADIPVTRDDFERVVNVGDLGASPGGNAGANPDGEPIDDLLREHASAAADTLLVFPAGRYRVGGVSLTGAGRFGMAAAEGATPTLVPTGPTDEIGPALLQFVNAEAFLFDGFALDFREEGVGGKLHVTTGGNLAVRNVQVRGQYSPNASGFHLAVEGEDATGLVENVSAPDGGRRGGWSIGAFVDRRHAGELTFRNCRFESFPNNGLYASAPGGDGGLRAHGGGVRVLGGLYRNNNIANVRLGGRGAVARNVTIVVDEVPPHNTLNARGLLLRNGRDHRVENCRIVLGENAGESLGAIVFNPDAGRVVVRDTEVRMDRDGLPAVNAPPPSEKAPDETGPVFENVAIRGTAAAGRTVDVAGRNRTTFRNCRVSQSGQRRDGIRFAGSEGCLLVRTTIDVTGDPVSAPRSSLQRRRVKVVG